MRHLALSLVPLMVAGCAATDIVSPELACQRRLAAAREVEPAEGDSFNHQAYAKVDRTGCSAKQLATLDKILALTKDLPILSDANLGAKDQATIAATFQRMSDAVIALDDLQQAIRSDLAQMEPPQ